MFNQYIKKYKNVYLKIILLLISIYGIGNLDASLLSHKFFHDDYDALRTSDIYLAAALSVRCHINLRCMDRYSNTLNDLDKDLHWYLDNTSKLEDGHIGYQGHVKIAEDLKEIVKERVARLRYSSYI